MLKQCLIAENKKLKSSVVWLLFLVIPIFPAVMGTCNYVANLSVLKDGWYSLWRLEHFNHNWNLIMTAPVSPLFLLLAKFLVLLRMTILTQLWVGFLFFFCGKTVGLPGMMPVVFLFWLLRGCIGSMGIIALSLLFSMLIKSFSVPVILALCGSIASLGMVSRGSGYLWPYALMMLGMNANSSTDHMSAYVPFLIATLLFPLLFLGLSLFYLKKKDVCSA